MNLQLINDRVDKALEDNRRAERMVSYMALGIFATGVIAIGLAYWLKNTYVAGGSTVVQVFLLFPINEIRKLRRDNVILQAFPALIFALPPDKLAEQIIKLLDYLRGGK